MYSILRKIINYIFISIVITTLLSSCKTNKNTFIHRGYHNLTARYNGYYYATESIKEGEEKIKSAYKYDYDKFLPVFLMPTNESAKATFPEFDKAIKKSTNCIQRHTIKDKKTLAEITTAGKWIDNNWNAIGISHFYKREFFSGIEAFEYVVRSYKSKDKYKALIFLARSYNEIGSPTQAEPIIGVLKDDKNISNYARKELPAVQADYYMKRGMFKEAEAALIDALKPSERNKKKSRYRFNFAHRVRPSKATKARYSFILGQLYEEKKENKKAIQFYQKTISAKPDYDLVFNAKMKIARLFDVKNGNIIKLKRDLLNMLKDIKNKEYLDVIYYTLGEISEKEKNESEAIKYYKLSVKNSTQNPKQKALSYLKLGDVYFENANYTLSFAYYDSTMITLPKDYKDYDKISNRKVTLETLVGYIKTIQREDSLQMIAKMSDKEKDVFVTNLIQKIEAEEERIKEEKEARELLNQNPLNGNVPAINNLPGMTGAQKGDWYFYNQTTIAFGLNDFIKKFGTRKLEDNWRRSQKALTNDSQENPNEKDDDLSSEKGNSPKKTKADDKKKKDFYLKGLPNNDSLLKISNGKIIDAYYNLGSIYKDELGNNKKSIASFEELNKRFIEHKYRPSTYYQLYKIFLSVKNQPQADYYKNKLFNEFPNCEYTQIIKNPNYTVEQTNQKGVVELFYTETFDQYALNNYEKAFELSNESVTKFGKNDFSAKFLYINALCIGKLKGLDSLEIALKKLQIFYPKDETAKEAQLILEALYNLKNPANGSGAVNKTDTFTLNMQAEHFVIVVCPDDPAIANPFKLALTEFNSNYYSISNLTISNSLFGSAEQITNIKSFKNGEEALRYVDNLKKDKAVFNTKLKAEQFTILAISADNFPRLFRKKKTTSYIPFYIDHYRSN